MFRTGSNANFGPSGVAQNPEGPTFWLPFYVRICSLERSGDSKFRRRILMSSPFLVRAHEKPCKSRSGSTKKACCLRRGYTNFFFARGKVHITKIGISSIFWSASFLHCVSAICGTVARLWEVELLVRHVS